MTIREIITTALRKIAVIASGETPTEDEAADALALLQAIILEHPGMSGSAWRDVFASSDAAIVAKDGERIDPGAHAPAITLPLTVQRHGRTITTRSLSRVWIISGSQIGLWLFSTEWRRADALALEDKNPLGDDTNNGLSAQLAARFAEEFGKEPGPSCLAQAQRSERSIRARLYRSPHEHDCIRDYL